MSSALISQRGFCEAGSRNWFWNSDALEGFRSELDRFRPCVGSMSCCAFCTMLEKLENMIIVSLPGAHGDATQPLSSQPSRSQLGGGRSRTGAPEQEQNGGP